MMMGESADELAALEWLFHLVWEMNSQSIQANGRARAQLDRRPCYGNQYLVWLPRIAQRLNEADADKLRPTWEPEFEAETAVDLRRQVEQFLTGIGYMFNHKATQ